MSEEFAIHRTFGYGSAVDGKIGSVFACGAVVNNTREMLFSDTGLTGYEHAEVGLRHLHGNLYRPVELRVGTDNFVSLFDRLYFALCHNPPNFCAFKPAKNPFKNKTIIIKTLMTGSGFSVQSYIKFMKHKRKGEK